MIKKQLFSLVLAALMAASACAPADADTYDEIDSARAEKDAAEYALENTRDKIYTLNEERSALKGYLEELDAEISYLSSELETISEQITEKTTEIRQAEAAVKRAKYNERKQYNSMMSRIQYMYENGSADLMVSLLSSEDVTSFLNKAAEAQELAEYDREKLDQFKETKEAVIERQLSLEEDQQKLEELKLENEEALQEVQSLAASTDEKIEVYTERISEEEYKASGLAEEVSWQRSRIASLEAQAAAEEAERERQAEREAEEARWAEEHGDDSDEDYDSDGDSASEDEEYDESSDEDYDSDEDGFSEDEEYGESSDEDYDSDEDGASEDEEYDESSDEDYDSDDDDDSSSGSSGTYLGNFTLTAYCWCAKCNGSAGQPTASGTTPRSGHTVAMGGVDFGTKLLINGTVYTVEDRGTSYGHVDIFMDSHEEALDFGMQYADVYLLE